MPRESGFARYESFFNQPPALVVEWHDDATSAKGWLCINALRGGAAGGGTRMRPGGTRDEAVFLAKTMQAKFNVCGPAIGGGKSVIDFDVVGAARQAAGGKDPSHAQIKKIKHDVLSRWFKHVGPMLKSCYGTGGDVGVDEALDTIPVTQKAIALAHPQEGIVRGHFPRFTPVQFKKSIKQLQDGVLAKVVLEDLKRRAPWTIADVATGWGVVCALRAYYAAKGETLEGKRAIIEGFGAVGGFTAYYLNQLGAKVVAVSSAGGGADRRGIRVAADPDGLDVLALLRHREDTSLPSPSKSPHVQDSQSGQRLFYFPADIFVPAAISHTIGSRTLDQLEACQVKVIAPGSNNPFRITPPPPPGSMVEGSAGAASLQLREMVANMLVRMRQADQRFAIVPDFIANSGMARTFAYCMKPGAKVSEAAILGDIRSSIEKAMKKLTAGADLNRGLLDRAYSMFLD
jgi:glutamate dehydrogenase (NAD(P)+)